MTEFEGVIPALAKALTTRGYTTLTPVQKAVLAPELSNADALVSAQTGSGKTVAFGLALAPTLLNGEDHFTKAVKPLALVIAPTRELAMQVMRELEWLFAKTGAKVTSCVGGMDMRSERRALQQGVHIVVGTPGRLRDHVERGSFDPTELKAIVLDEADEMLDMGFREELECILDASPKERRTLMFSATVSRPIAALAKRYQRDAIRVTTQNDTQQHIDIEYKSYTVAPNDRENAIINVLRYFDAKNSIIFCGTRATVNHMTSRLNNRGFAVVALSGELSQNERTHALQAMRDGRARVCVATDVAARGIDLPNLDLVIHADIPKNKESLLHRSGRTGRAGRKGTCALIVPHNWRKRTERLLDNAKIEAEWQKPPSSEDIAQIDRNRILDDESLSLPLSDEDKLFAQELLARHSAEQIAGAFVRLRSAAQPTPEELLDSGPAPKERERSRPRDDFKNGVWFSLNVGRRHTAEARWLLPMLCRAGHVTKSEIGAIRIHHDETHVELAPQCVDRFLEAVGPSRKVEKTISVTRVDGIPAEPKDTASDPRGKSYAQKKPFGKKPYKKSKLKSEGQPPRSEDKVQDRGDTKPWDQGNVKPKGKKPYTPKTAKTGNKPFVKSGAKPTAKPGGTKASKFAKTSRPNKSGKPGKPGYPGQKTGGKGQKPAKGGGKGSPSKGSQSKGAGQQSRPAKAGSSPLKRKILSIKAK